MRSLKRFVKSFSKNDSGATAVEFSLVVLPFLLTIFGIMEVGRLMWSMNSIQFAIDETSRYAAINSSLSEAEFSTYAQERLASMLMGAGNLQITSSQYTSNCVDFVEIEGTYQMDTMISGALLGDFGSFQYEVSSRSPILN